MDTSECPTCGHNMADLPEGDAFDGPVKYCQRCGTVDDGILQVPKLVKRLRELGKTVECPTDFADLILDVRAITDELQPARSESAHTNSDAPSRKVAAGAGRVGDDTNDTRTPDDDIREGRVMQFKTAGEMTDFLHKDETCETCGGEGEVRCYVGTQSAYESINCPSCGGSGKK